MRDKEAVKKELARLYAKYGLLSPEIVEREARSPSSPLHSEFEWDDALAGLHHRWEQARRLIRSVRVIVTVNRVQVKSVAYVRDPRVPVARQAYVSTEDAAKNNAIRYGVLDGEIKRAEAAIHRTLNVCAALGLEKDAKRLLSAILRFRKKVALATGKSGSK